MGHALSDNFDRLLVLIQELRLVNAETSLIAERLAAAPRPDIDALRSELRDVSGKLRRAETIAWVAGILAAIIFVRGLLQ